MSSNCSSTISSGGGVGDGSGSEIINTNRLGTSRLKWSALHFIGTKAQLFTGIHQHKFVTALTVTSCHCSRQHL